MTEKQRKESSKQVIAFLSEVVLIISFLLVFQPIETYADFKIKVGDKFPNFVLEGVDGNQYELDKMDEKLVILIMGPKDKKENIIQWEKMLHKTFSKNDSMEIFVVFNMQGIPFFVTKDFVRNKVKQKQDEHPTLILMDWDQKVSKLLGVNNDQTDILVFVSGGVLAGHQFGAYSEEKFRILKDKIMDILKSDSLNEKK